MDEPVTTMDNIDSSLVIKSVDDMAGHRIGVMSGSVQEVFASSVEGCSVVRFETITDCYLALSQGKIDGLLTSSISYKYESAPYPVVQCICDTIKPCPVGVVFNKDKSELREQFNKFQKEYINSTLFKESVDDWSDPNTTRQMPDWSNEDHPNGVLKLATASIVPPYDFIKDGKIVGIEVEMVSHFAHSLGMKLEIVDMNFSALVPYINSGKADIGACVACVTPERAESVDFADIWGYEKVTLISRPINFKTAETGFHFTQFKESFEKTLFKEERYKLILQGLWMTLFISIIAAILGTLFGIIICFGQKKGGKVLVKTFDLYVSIMQSMPQVVFLMIMYYIVFGRTDIEAHWVAIIAFALCFGAYTSVIFKTTLNGIDKGQTEAGLSMGFNLFETFIHIIMPQMVTRALPVYKNEFIGLVKATSIVGYIAVFDLTRAGDIIRSRTYEAFFPLIIVTVFYFIVIWTLTRALKYVEIRTKPKRNKYTNQKMNH